MDSVHLDLFFWHRRSLVRARHHGKLRESRQATRQNCPVDKTKRIKKMKESVQRGQRRRALTTNSTTRRTRHDTCSKAHLTRWNGCATSHTPCVVRALECSTSRTLGRADPEDDCGPISLRRGACKGSPSPMSWLMAHAGIDAKRRQSGSEALVRMSGTSNRATPHSF